MVPGAEEEIEAHLPHRDRLRVAKQFRESVHLFGIRRDRLVGMPATCEVDAGVLFGDCRLRSKSSRFNPTVMI